jgi:hypothetical protein
MTARIEERANIHPTVDKAEDPNLEKKRKIPAR